MSTTTTTTISTISKTSSISAASSTGVTGGGSTLRCVAAGGPTRSAEAVDTTGRRFRAPDFSINDVLKAIPKECFRSSLAKSGGYVLRDVLCMVVLACVAHTAIPLVGSAALRGVCWAVYVSLLALPMTGLWILAHECGHQAFSDYGWVNDAVGWVLHSYCLNPYFSWKFSHRKHHKNNGHLRKDMAYVPPTLDEWKHKRGVVSLAELAEDSPLVSIATLLVQQTVGFQAYLLFDATGQPHPQLAASTSWWRRHFGASHFNPHALIFDKSNFWYIVASDVGILLQLAVLRLWVRRLGAFSCLVDWFLPYLLVNHWVVFITYLQHTDMSLPRYTDAQWTFPRGAGATIDRDFGFVGWFFFHDLIETHVLHHYCGRIPFYNARKATEAIKLVLGSHYRQSDTNMFKMLWQALRWCEFVQGDNGVMMFRNHNGNGVPPVDTPAAA